MIKALITGAGGDVCNGIIKSLLYSNFEIDIFIAGNSKKKLQKYPSFKTILCPHIKNIKYISFLKKIIDTNKIDIVFSGINDELPTLSKHSEKLNCYVVVDRFKDIQVFYDKFKSYQFFKKYKINTPVTFLSSKKNQAKINGPIVMKQKIGSGSKKIKIYKNKNLLKKHKKNFIIQEYLPGHDFTAFLLKTKNKNYLSILKRELNNGQTIYAEFYKNKKIEFQLNNIIKKLPLMFCNIQFKIIDNNVFVYEINPRFSGSIGLHLKKINFPKILIQKFFEHKIKIKKKINMKGIRLNEFVSFY